MNHSSFVSLAVCHPGPTLLVHWIVGALNLWMSHCGRVAEQHGVVEDGQQLRRDSDKGEIGSFFVFPIAAKYPDLPCSSRPEKQEADLLS